MSQVETILSAATAARLAALGETAILDPDGDEMPLLTRTVIIEREHVDPIEMNPSERSGVKIMRRRALVLVANDATLGHTVLTPGVSIINFKWNRGDDDNTAFRVVGPEVKLDGGFFYARVEG